MSLIKFEKKTTNGKKKRVKKTIKKITHKMGGNKKREDIVR